MEFYQKYMYDKWNENTTLRPSIKINKNVTKSHEKNMNRI